MSTESQSTPPAAPQPAAKTITFKYRIYQFENGLGETVYRAKRVGAFMGLRPWVNVFHWRDNGYRWIEKWETREEVEDAILADAEERRRHIRYGQARKLRLIITEDITA
jgi:hypothetical protein